MAADNDPRPADTNGGESQPPPAQTGMHTQLNRNSVQSYRQQPTGWLNTPSARNVSASFAPDRTAWTGAQPASAFPESPQSPPPPVPETPTNAMHQQQRAVSEQHSPDNQHEPPQVLTQTVPKVSLGRADTLNIPKRRTNSAHLGRSLSVGGPQRLPSTLLHREPKYEPVVETPPASVYIAGTHSGYQTAWIKVRDCGKGSFSQVIVASPAMQFVKPELAEEVRQQTERDIKALDNPETLDGRRSTLFAVKITALNHSSSASELGLFKRDLDIMADLPRFPSLIRLIAWSLDEQVHKRGIFVLPYCCGGDLFDLVAKHRSKLSAALVRRIFADVCSAVVFLHAHAIVHRDIKLENVLLDVPVSVLLGMAHPIEHHGAIGILTDLGLARQIDFNDPMLTTRCGSDDYVPPEIMMGQPYDGRETDSWALGVLLYAMMEGRLPFDPPPNSQQQFDNRRARLRTAHRIARVDWGWYKRAELSEVEQEEWGGGKEVVEGCLKRRQQRRLARDTLQMPWVAEARGPQTDSTDGSAADDDDIWKIFVQ